LPVKDYRLSLVTFCVLRRSVASIDVFVCWPICFRMLSRVLAEAKSLPSLLAVELKRGLVSNSMQSISWNLGNFHGI
jgi:hypothetical protein